MDMKKAQSNLTQNTELGPVPSDWKAVRFEDVLIGFASGATPYRGRPEYYQGTIRWITSGELNYNTITDTIEKITEAAVRDTNLRILPAGTFLMAITGLEAAGTRGSCGIVGKESTTNQSCMALMPKNGEIITEYLYHFYIKYGDEFAFRYCQGTKQQSYTGKIAKILPINLPPTLTEQRAVATALTDVDNLITALEQLITKKKAIKQAAMQELLTGKRRLEGFEVEWIWKTFDDCFDFLNTGSNSRSDLSDNAEIKYIHYGDIHSKWSTVLDCSNALIPTIDEEKVSGLPFLKDGDLVLADASEDYTGIGVGVEIKNINGSKVVAGLHTLLLRSKNDLIADGFKAYLTSKPEVRSALIRIATGISVYGISKNQLKQVEIHLPPTVKEQRAIATILIDMDAEITTQEQRRDKYKTVKQGMMQQLLTGKTRLV